VQCLELIFDHLQHIDKPFKESKRMKLRVVVLVVVIIALVGGASSCSSGAKADDGKREDTPAAQVRVGCMFHPFSTVSIDGSPFLENMVYPYISDYQSVSAGNHTLTVMPRDGNVELAASLDLDLGDGHQYLVVSYGNVPLQSDHALMIIDETEMVSQIAEDHASLIFIHLVVAAPGLNAQANGETFFENLTYGQAAMVNAPIGQFEASVTLAPLPDVEVYSDTFNGLPHTHTVITMIGSPLDSNVYMTVFSPLNMAEFFAQMAPIVGYYDEVRDMLAMSGLDDELSGEGPFTVFAPWDSTFLDIPGSVQEKLRTDPVQVTDIMRYHVVPEYLTPLDLFYRSKISTLQGFPIAITVDPPNGIDRPHLWINGIAKTYQDYRVSNGVFYEHAAVLLPPSP
jgi:hypothetical protein